MGCLNRGDGLGVFIELRLVGVDVFRDGGDEVLVGLIDLAVEAVALDLALSDLNLRWE